VFSKEHAQTMLSLGQRLGTPEIEVVSRLSRGGLSEVWLGRMGNAPICLKAFCRDPVWTDEEVEECRGYFNNEVTWLSQLRHARLSNYRGVIRYLEEPILLLDFIDGTSLRKWLDKEPIPRSLDSFFALVGGISQGVRFLHEKKLLHRDVAPRNTMVGAEMQTYLIDLQFVRSQVEKCAQETKPLSHGIGDFAYSAPELFDMLDEPYDHTIDIYSLGAIFIEILTGRPPRRSNPSQVRPDLPIWLSDFLWAMVDENPRNRPSWSDITPILNLPPEVE